ncbi:MAG: hypothetical protein ABS49_09720 [Erythrobacter sp. SCN 62-14]|nr:MAG: hypothetical protein ABS49_09720 [Erythrobacter sp. SCN 62-14]
MDLVGKSEDHASGDTRLPYHVPLVLFANLTSQAILLIDPSTNLVIFASTRARTLIFPNDLKADLPAPLSSFVSVDTQLVDQFNLAMRTSGSLSFGIAGLAGRPRLSAKAQRIDLYDDPPLLLISLQDDPELSRRFRSLNEEILALSQEVERRREVERSLSLTTSALRRSLAIVRQLNSIPISGGEYYARAAKVVSEALGAQSAAVITRAANSLVCSGVAGPRLSKLTINKLLETLTPALLSAWDHDLQSCNSDLAQALDPAAGSRIAPAYNRMFPFAVGGKVKGAVITFSDDPAIFAGMTDLESGLISEALGSLATRADMEAKLSQSAKMEAIGQLTGGIAHDFNNLLTVVLGNAEALTDELTKLPELREMAEITANAALRGAELTKRLLAFARKQTLEPRVMDVSQLVQSMDQLLRRTLPANIAIEIVRSGGLWKTEVDPGQLESALLNIALNARDAMPDGGSLTIEIANAALDDDYVVSEPSLEAGQYVLVAVTDTGHGIPSEDIQHIFQPFFTTKEVGKGTGLGLSMVYGFVKQSGGHIRIYSEVGEGTTIKLYFPRSLTHQGSINAPIARPRSLGGNETILVVEDDKLVRQYVVSQLKSLGYRVFESGEGKSALEILHQVPDIDLLFTDVVMPGGIGGRELSEAARTLRPGLKVLFTSGYTENSIVHNGKLDPGIELLSKPYRREQLAMKLRKVLDAP